MRVFLFVLLTQALLCKEVFGDLSSYEKEKHESDDHLLQMVVEGNVKFAHNFFSHVANEYPKQNVICSPFSVSVLFSMISAGAKGQTQKEILEGLYFNTSSNAEINVRKGYKHLIQILNQANSDSVLSIANALFAEESTTFLEMFLKALKDYKVEAIPIDFHTPAEAKNQINSYVEEKTNGMVKNLLDSVDNKTVAVVLNTIYFKGKWKYAFDKKLTHDADFYVDNKTVVKVPMMRRQGLYRMAYIEKVGCTFVEVPYVGNFSAFFAIPDHGRFQEVEKALKNNCIPEWAKEMKPIRIHLLIPKFQMSSTFDLKKELIALGIKLVFSDEADLSGITGFKNLKLSKAVQKAVVGVDETGTEAAAASAGVVAVLGVSAKAVVADRPFIFLIRNIPAKVDLFFGKYLNP
ncbi:serine protease inhibitor A3K-like [Hyperolius riggenbachi]|uniref:serine protease inhibitor A3K-like n=1 Tax=Hyperolius riggenbachi TaxID=752182 RepID=UPI0035A336DC